MSLVPMPNFRSTMAVATPNRSTIRFNGRALATLRAAELRLTQDELARRAGMTKANIQRFEREEVVGTHAKNFEKLAEAVGMPVKELLIRLAVPGSKPPADPAFPTGAGRTLHAAMVPQFDHGLAASRRSEIADPKPVRLVPLPVEGRAFVVAVDGDCMAPAYLDGELVVFSYDVIEREGVIDGEGYYVQLSDGTGTFKQVYRDGEDLDCWQLRCVNRKKYPKAIRVHRDEVVRVAKAVGKFVPAVPAGRK